MTFAYKQKDKASKAKEEFTLKKIPYKRWQAEQTASEEQQEGKPVSGSQENTEILPAIKNMSGTKL